jgi:iron complex outermembrane receptor protein
MSKQTFVFQASRLSPTGPLDTVPAHTILNAQIGYQFGDSKTWSAVLAATNLTDKYYFHTLFWGSTVATAGVIAPPREYTFTLRKSF